MKPMGGIETPAGRPRSSNVESSTPDVAGMGRSSTFGTSVPTHIRDDNGRPHSRRAGAVFRAGPLPARAGVLIRPSFVITTGPPGRSVVIGRNWEANRASDALQSTYPCGSPIDTRKWGLDSLVDSQVFFEAVALSGPSRLETTVLVGDLTRGDETAANLLTPMVYEELRALAAGLLRHETPGHTLQPTALVHEAYMRLVDQTEVDYQGRAHFIALAARTMRRVLVDHARAREAKKRGGGRERVTLDSSVAFSTDHPVDLLALDEALTKLASLHQRQAQIVDLRFFGGLTIEETAVVLEVSHATVEVDWKMARSWLRRELAGGYSCR